MQHEGLMPTMSIMPMNPMTFPPMNPMMVMDVQHQLNMPEQMMFGSPYIPYGGQQNVFFQQQVGMQQTANEGLLTPEQCMVLGVPSGATFRVTATAEEVYMREKTKTENICTV